jgi:hypothetical protein
VGPAEEDDVAAATSGNCCLKVSKRSSPGFCELVLQSAPSQHVISLNGRKHAKLRKKLSNGKQAVVSVEPSLTLWEFRIKRSSLTRAGAGCQCNPRKNSDGEKGAVDLSASCERTFDET